MPKKNVPSLEKLQAEIAKRQAKIDKINAERSAIRLKLFDEFFKKNDGDKLRNTLKEIGEKFPKSEQKQLESMFDWWKEVEEKSDSNTPNQPTQNAPQQQPTPQQQQHQPK